MREETTWRNRLMKKQEEKLDKYGISWNDSDWFNFIEVEIEQIKRKWVKIGEDSVKDAYKLGGISIIEELEKQIDEYSREVSPFTHSESEREIKRQTCIEIAKNFLTKYKPKG